MGKPRAMATGKIKGDPRNGHLHFLAFCLLKDKRGQVGELKKMWALEGPMGIGYDNGEGEGEEDHG